MILDYKIREPSIDECSQQAQVYETDNNIGFACWYPQMGGYSGKCVAIFDREWKLNGNGSSEGGCIELCIWHDGEFPFTDKDGEPQHIHICCPEQFIQLGKFLMKINNRYCVKKE